MQYSIGSDYIWKEVGEQIVILNLDSGRYFSLNSTGTMIWSAILEKRSLDGIVEQLCASFEIDEATAREDAKTMIDDFLSRGIIQAD